MDRCKLAWNYYQKGFNCAQSVLAAFSDLTHLSEREALAVSGGFGGGVGGTHEEVCGALSGAVIVLSILFPHVEEDTPETKRRLYRATRDLRNRFEKCFGKTRCNDLLAEKIESGDRTPGAQRLGVNSHCAILIVTTVELVEEMLREAGVSC